MSDHRVSVHAWPEAAPRALAALRSTPALAVIRIATPDTEMRHAAREHLRAALRDLLAALLQQPAATLPLVAQPGQALVLDLSGTSIGLSVSHAPGLSVAAVHRYGPVGVDVMRVGEGAGWMPDWEAVARDYLGPPAQARINQVTPAQRALAFAREWTALEARLKCLGMALTEWTPALQQRLATCTVTALDVPNGWWGTVAVPGDQGTQSSACM
ncbi:MAG: 4'-phosphopantetheinyl transferase superfamily protein [Rhodoferax sp.]